MHNVLQAFEWNTGRAYSLNGQTIRVMLVELDEGGLEYWFSDITRNIDGVIPAHSRDTSLIFIKRNVMDKYDVHKYDYLSQSKFDGLWESVME